MTFLVVLLATFCVTQASLYFVPATARIEGKLYITVIIIIFAIVTDKQRHEALK